MIERLVPASVSCACSREDHGDADTLFPEEAAQVARSTPARRAEFASVRACARRAMARLGLPPVPVLRGPRGAPLWPPGLVGSMTHCQGYRGAALASAREFRSLGIDAEPHVQLPSAIRQVVVSATEERWMAVQRPALAIHWDRLLFSAKESVFKAWYPLTLLELDFNQAEIVFRRTEQDASEGTFTARLLCRAPGMPGSFEGRWLVSGGIVATAVTVPAE
ncbi:4'-phosphopantetheinyl transferase superfamily protein [Streptomyces sp. ITFR-6]|uniref:4'-phosphopantetheinyl transferase family protein n=1 Tax=Streptomyces sp. ITFR-6 TaxID=3075197 RepID=UPI00288AEBB5|nr:4'-phosphopantetheinyl transferase superfamily protein [Streptomyces sp. ITFR-6]WNI32307.1 4'-phosphopantetheinyl transferase superfamily protein [Streptomyces sp. ITFR-6]